MTTFTLKDYVENKTSDVTVNVEPIPFAGLVSIQDKEDTEQMLRNQLHIVQAECQRLRQKLKEYGCNE
jgi:ribonuclease PH